MKHLKRFNESEDNQNKDKSSMDACIEAAKECIKKCEECKEKCGEDGKENCVNSCSECIEVCKLYIYSCENDSPNFEKVGRLAVDVAMDCANTCSDEGCGTCVESCLNFAEEVEKCLEE
jgi:hypothetical protein